MKRKRKAVGEASAVADEEIEDKEEDGRGGNFEMEIAWQTQACPSTNADYIFRGGRRHVRPYYFEFISHVKKRWVGKKIVELFADEFRGRPYDYYVRAVESGRIQVNGEIVPVSYAVKSNEKISHFVHRHEPPVGSCDVSILQEDHDVIAVWKPATIPVHPCGQYRKNTVVGILQAEYDLGPLFRIQNFSEGLHAINVLNLLSEALYTKSYCLYVSLVSIFKCFVFQNCFHKSYNLAVHRLDRLVSGLLILARSATKAEFFRQEIEAGVVQKQYIARVIGVFPIDELIIDANINYNHRDGRSSTEDGVSRGEGKVACTKFTRISTNGIHSIVLCKPITGRTHQIRVHLQHAGYPIANDILYSSKHSPILNDQSLGDITENLISNGPDDFLKEDFDIDPLCTNCPHLIPKGYGGKEEGLWLHCMRYSGTDWLYECPLPEWAILV